MNTCNMHLMYLYPVKATPVSVAANGTAIAIPAELAEADIVGIIPHRGVMFSTETSGIKGYSQTGAAVSLTADDILYYVISKDFYNS